MFQKRKIVAGIMLAAIFFVNLESVPVEATGGVLAGTGDPGDPFIIADCVDLVALDDTETYPLDANYQLGGNIDCTAQGPMTPLFDISEFAGVFDGNDFSITGLDLVGTGFDMVGLFSFTSGAEIYDLTIEGTLDGDAIFDGSLIGYASGTTTVNNVESYFDITDDAGSGIGGLIGRIEGDDELNLGLITDSYFEGSITLDLGDTIQGVGGLVGTVDYSTISGSDANATISIDTNSYIVLDIGGLSSIVENSDVTDSNATGSITIAGDSDVFSVGGLISYFDAADVTGSSSEVDLTLGTAEDPLDSLSNVGGLIGFVGDGSNLTFANNYSDQDIDIEVIDEDAGASTVQYVGGLVGYYCDSFDTDDCAVDLGPAYSYSNITINGADGGVSNVGGAFGYTVKPTLNDIFVEGNISITSDSVQFVGGLVSYMEETLIDGAHYEGAITVDVTDVGGYLGSIGGLVGYSELEVGSEGEPSIGITDAYSKGSILIGQGAANDAVEFVGGLIGYYADGLDSSDSYSEMDITVDANDYIQAIGGIVGFGETDNARFLEGNRFENIYYHGDIDVEVDEAGTGIQFVGGYAGMLSENEIGVVILNVFSGGSITTTNTPSEIGGFVGYIDGDGFTLGKTYASSEISSTGDVGGYLGMTFGAITIEDGFSAAIIDAGENSGAVAQVVGSTDIFVNFYYDSDLAGGFDCVNGEEPFAECTAVNVAGAAPNYFKNNTTNDPLDQWDFDEETGFWATEAGSYPYLAAFRNPNLLADVIVTINDELGNSVTGGTAQIYCDGMGVSVSDGSGNDADGENNGVVVFAGGGTPLTNAGCDDGDHINQLVASKDGYVLANATGDLVYDDDEDNENTAAMQFGQKITVTAEGGLALSEATVTAGENDTACTEDGVTGIYYCAVLAAEDGTENDVTVTKTGYVNNTAGDTVDRANILSAQGEVAVTVLYPLKVIVTDELGNGLAIANLDTIQYNAGNPTYSSGNTAYWVGTATRAALAVEEAGFIDAQTTNNSLAASGSTGVTTTETVQTVITFAGDSSSSTASNNDNELIIAATAKGLQYMLKTTMLKSEIGGTITAISSGVETASSGEPSDDVTISNSGGASVHASAVADNTIYIAVSGDGGGDDVFGIQLQDVTADDGLVNGTYFVVIDFTDTGNLISAAAGQAEVEIGTGADGDFSNTNGFKYPLKVAVADELGTAISELDDINFGGFGPYYSNENIFYFGQTAGGAELTISKDGYVDSIATNVGLDAVFSDQEDQTTIELGEYESEDENPAAGSDSQIQGLQFAHKVTVQDEATNAFSGATVAVGEDSCDEDAETGIYYCDTSTDEDDEVNVTSAFTGYVTASTEAFNRTANDDTQIAYTLTMEVVPASGGGGGGGSSNKKSKESEEEVELPDDPADLTYEEMLELVRDLGLVEKEMAVEANKCEALVIMSRAFKWELEEEVTVDGFFDTPSWCKPAAKYAKDKGIVHGREEGFLGMDSPVLRYEFVVMMYKTLAATSEEHSAVAYKDAIVEWAQSAINWAHVMDYMTGFSDGTFGGERGVLKQDIGVVLLRIMLSRDFPELAI